MQEPYRPADSSLVVQPEALASHRNPHTEQRNLFLALLALQALDREPLLLAIGHLALEPIRSPADDGADLALSERDLVVDLRAGRTRCVLLVAEVILLIAAAAGDHGDDLAHGAADAGYPRVRNGGDLG